MHITNVHLDIYQKKKVMFTPLLYSIRILDIGRTCSNTQSVLGRYLK